MLGSNMSDNIPSGGGGSGGTHGLWGAPQPGARRRGSMGSSHRTSTTGGGSGGGGGGGNNKSGGGGLFNDGSLDRYLSSKPAPGAGGGRRGGATGGSRTVRSSVSAARSARVAKEYPGLGGGTVAYSRRSSDDAPAPSASGGGGGSGGDRTRQSPGRMHALSSRGDRDRSARAIAAASAAGTDGNALIDGGIPTTIEASTEVMERQRQSRAAAAAKRGMRSTSALIGDAAYDDGPPLTIHIGGGGGGGGGGDEGLGNDGAQRGRRRSRGTRGSGARGASIASRDRSRGAGGGRRSRSLSVARGGGERSYMAMSRTGGGGADGAGFAASRLLDRQYKRSSDGGGPPKSISVFRSSSSFGSFGKLNSLMLDGLDDSSSDDDDDDYGDDKDDSIADIQNVTGNRDDREGGKEIEEETGPEATRSAPNLFSSSHNNDEHQMMRTQRRSSTEYSGKPKSGSSRSRVGQSGGADSKLWDSFRKSGRNRSSAAASANPYLSFGGGRETETSGSMPRRRHSDGKLSALVISEIDMSDDDSDADDGYANVGESARGVKAGRRARTFSDGALDRAVKLGLLDEDDVEEVVNQVDQEQSYTLNTLQLGLMDEDDGDEVLENLKESIGRNSRQAKNNNVDTEVEGMSYEERLRHYRAVIGEDGHLTDDDYGVGEEFEVDLRDNGGDNDEGEKEEGHPIRRVHSDGKLNLAANMLGEDHRPIRERSGRPGKDGNHRKHGEAENDRTTRDRKEHHGCHQRRHSDGALNIAAGMFDDITISDDDLEAEGGTNRRNVMKVLGEPRKKRGQRPSKNYGSSNRSGSGLQTLKLNKLQALEQGAIRGIGSAAADRDRPPMTITIGGDRPSPSSRWGEDGCKVLANDDETLEAEGEVYASQHRRAARRRSLKDDIPQDEAIKKGPYEMYLLGVERMERRRSNDSGGKLGRRSSIGSEGRLGGRRGSLR